MYLPSKMISAIVLILGKYVPTQQNYNRCNIVVSWKICTPVKMTIIEVVVVMLIVGK